MTADARAKPRVRASTACTACRVRRTKCVIPVGLEACDHCRRSGLQCVSLDDDKRKRPTPKANTANLAERVELLESLLSQQASNKAHDSGSHQDNDSPPKQQQHGYPSGREVLISASKEGSREYSSGRSQDRSPGKTYSAVTEPQSPEQVDGGLRYIGRPIRSSLFEGLTLSDDLAEYKEQKERSLKLLRDLSQATKDHLMYAFWTQYNSIFHLVHRESFEKDGEGSEGPSYNSFLHICMMAMGCKFSDKAVVLGFHEAEIQLEREAKSIAECGLGSQREVANVQALLILSDMELARGKDNTGWMYSGKYYSHFKQFTLEILVLLLYNHLRGDRTHPVSPNPHVVVYWTFCSGRPACIETSESAIPALTMRLESSGDFRNLGFESSFEVQIYQRLLTLMDLTGEITRNMSTIPLETGLLSYLEAARLDREMNSWYSSLPQLLEWTSSNIEIAPLSYFFLHQQYHSTLILLHRSLGSKAKLGRTTETSPELYAPALLELSRTVCFNNAGRVARIFKQYRQRFGIAQRIFTGTQHAGPAVVALLASIPQVKDHEERKQALDDLHCLIQVLQVMSKSNLAAQRLLSVVERQLRNVGLGLEDLSELTISFPKFCSKDTPI